MKIGFIGAGKVGFTLGKYLTIRGMEVSGYLSRTREHAQQAAAFTHTKWYDDLPAILASSDVLFLTVPDDHITACYQALPGDAIKRKLICHCSGALSAHDAFPGMEQTGAFGYAVHPLFAVNDPYRSYLELADVFFCLEGDPAHQGPLVKLFADCGNPVQILSAQNKVRYHAAAAAASNLVVALVDESIELLTGCGFSRQDALKALRPLLLGNMDHLVQDGPAASLTGPVERGDAVTVGNHLRAMPTKQDRELYRLLSRRLVRLAEQKHPARNYRAICELLEKGEAT